VLLSEAIFVVLIAVVYRRRKFPLLADALPPTATSGSASQPTTAA
jgi:hypothetical protein